MDVLVSARYDNKFLFGIEVADPGAVPGASTRIRYDLVYVIPGLTRDPVL